MGMPPFVPEPEPEEEPTATTEESTAPDRRIKAAMAWLKETMGDGEARLASEMEALAVLANIPKATLTLARQRCHIRSERIKNRWVWTPPRSWKEIPVGEAKKK